jgi:serine/threonine protein kinase
LSLQYLHSKQIYHRDIKLENILIDHKTLEIKICDLGSCERGNGIKILKYKGTKGYIAPELQPYLFSGSYIMSNELAKSDVFSLGVLLYCLAFNQYPF